MGRGPSMRLRSQLGEIGRLFSEGVEPAASPPQVEAAQCRRKVFQESPLTRARRLLRVARAALQPGLVANLATTLDLMLRERLVQPDLLPDPCLALSYADGLAGLATDLAPATMIRAYGKGLSPSASLGPVAWHSRERRHVSLPFDVIHTLEAASAASAPEWAVTFDRDMDAVLIACGRQSGGAMMPERLLAGFSRLFEAGFAHSFEVRDHLGRIVAGGFGVAVGRVFVIEGAFEVFSPAAKFGLLALARQLRDWNFTLVECAPDAAWVDAKSFHPMTRADFLAHVTPHMQGESAPGWTAPAKPARMPQAGWRRLAA